MSPFWCFMLAVYMFSIGFTYGVNYDTKVVPIRTEKVEFKIDPYTVRVSELCASFELWKKNVGI